MSDHEEVTVRKTLGFAVTLLVVSVVAPSAAQAAGRSGPGFEFGGYIFRANFDNESNIENDEGLGARFGWMLTPEHEIEFSIDRVSTEDEFGLGLDVDLTTFKAGYLYNFIPGGVVSPFFTVGGGAQKISISEPALFGGNVTTEETDPMGFAAFGVRFYIGDVFHFRVDGGAQAILPDGDLDNTLVDGVFSGGVGWTIGGR